MPGLTRSKTMPARVRTPSAKVAASRRKASKKSAASARRKSTTTKKVKDIVLSLAETKFFNTTTKGAQVLTVDATAAFGTFGLGTTAIKYTAGTNVADLDYGGTMVSMNMLKPFSNNSSISTNGWQRANSLSGSKCIPIAGKVTMNFRRTPFEIGGTEAEQKAILGTNVPLQVRVVRVTAKGAASSIVSYDPKQDLFLDQWGQENGIADTSPTMQSSDIGTQPLNRKKYHVLNDVQFTLHRPTQWEYHVGSGEVVRAGTNGTAGPSSKVITFQPQLATKKNGQVEYLDPNDGATTNAMDGQRREFILVHAWYPGITTKSDMSGVLPLDLITHITPESRFKDV